MRQDLAALSAPKVLEFPTGGPLPLRFAEIFREHHSAVTRWVRNLGISPADADDVVQEVFLVVHRRLPEFRGPGTVRGWLFSITRRVCSNVRRGRARAHARLQKSERPSPPRAPDEALLRAEAFELMQGFLDRLDSTQRVVYVLMEVEGMHAPEVAELLGLGVQTVYSKLRSARGKLKKMIARHRAQEEGCEDG
jgi:RNA polymerase sigma-70 factor (ECF subfamily)